MATKLQYLSTNIGLARFEEKVSCRQIYLRGTIYGVLGILCSFAKCEHSTGFRNLLNRVMPASRASRRLFACDNHTEPSLIETI